MKSIRFFLLVLFASILSACQSQATQTAIPSTANSMPTAIEKPSQTANKAQQAITLPAATSAPASGTSSLTIHSSSSNPNANNLIVVRDQAVANNGLIIDSVTAAQAGWVVLYFDKAGQPGELVTYVPVPAGKSNQFVIPLSNLKNPILQPNSIPDHQLLVMLTAGAPAPGNPVHDNNKMVMVSFILLAH